MSPLSVTPAIAMFAAAALCLLPVVACLFLLKLRYGAYWKTLFLGLLTFLFFGLMPVTILRSLTASLAADEPGGGLMYALLLSALVPAVAEQGGRYLYFRFAMRSEWQQGLATPLTFAVGYCIVSLFVVGANVFFGGVLMGRLYEAGGAEALAALNAELFTEEYRAQLGEVEQVMRNNDLLSFLAAGLERVFFLVFHLASAVLLYPAAVGRGPLWLFPAAVLTNILYNLPTVFSETERLVGTAPFLAATFLAAALTAAAAVFAWKHYGDYGLKRHKQAPKSFQGYRLG